jgi:outer membrane lipoprotein SlyB
MRPYSLLAATLFAASLVGCAAPRSAPPPVQSAQAPSTVRSAQIVAVESATATAQSGATASSGSTGGTVVGSAPTRLTVRFADGTEGLYDVAQPAASFRVGQPVSVISSGSSVTIVP